MIARRLVAVVGPTATGKSAIALELARRFGGAIVNADSRQVYRGMDIGTAKPDPATRTAVPHYLYDIADPTTGFSLGVYLEHARRALQHTWDAASTPWLVGGTGQYVWALLEAWTVPEVPPDNELRTALAAEAESAGPQALHDRLAGIDPVAAARIDVANVRRVIRAIEVHHHTGRPISDWQKKGNPGFDTLILGVDLPDAELDARIAARVQAMYDAGFVEEVRLLQAGGLPGDAPAMSAIGYQEAARALRGELPVAAAIEETIVATKRLVRRQRQWFRKSDARIHWGRSSDDFTALVEEFFGGCN